MLYMSYFTPVSRLVGLGRAAILLSGGGGASYCKS
jgi:hypothetical protein